MAKKFYKLTVEIEIDPTWVADGFDLTEERLQDMVKSDLGFAYDEEIRCKILKAPDAKSIAVEQGYKSLEDKLERESRSAA